jgi:hypothetical protein
LGTEALLVANDKSYMLQMNKGKHAYNKIISTTNDTVSTEAASTNPGSDGMYSSPTKYYRAITILTVLIVLLQHHRESGVNWPTATILIDNEKVITRGNELDPALMNVKQYLNHDFNLWMVISDH